MWGEEYIVIIPVGMIRWKRFLTKISKFGIILVLFEKESKST